MPELPDIVVYCEALEDRVLGRVLTDVQINNPFVLRTAQPPLSQVHDRVVKSVQRVGKRIVFAFDSADQPGVDPHAGSDAQNSTATNTAQAAASDGPLYLVIHLMIAGRLRWEPLARKAGARQALALLNFETGQLRLTEAGKKRRASIHLVAGDQALAGLHRGGLEVLTASYDKFHERVTASNHTLKRLLTDPGILSGIGNAYSDEILHRAGLSPMLQSQKVDNDTLVALYQATQAVLQEWTARLREEAAASKSGFPEKVTAFRPEMAVHGRYGKPCPVCQAPVQRIVYASNETNYCARCQTGGVVLKDRALSRLLKASWPDRLED